VVTSSRLPLSADDIRSAAQASFAVLAPLAAADWSRPASGLEWTCRQTFEHLLRAVNRYALNLANRTTQAPPSNAGAPPDLSIPDLLALLPLQAGLLAVVVEAAPATARGHHPFGLIDPSGFVGMSVVETILHTDDVVRGLGHTWMPPGHLCRRGLARLLPWAPPDVDPWAALLWATGRGDLPGRERTPANWAYQAAPLSEWDGTPRTLEDYFR
jgi:uncharacterized protein (TIGR03083 family)